MRNNWVFVGLFEIDLIWIIFKMGGFRGWKKNYMVVKVVDKDIYWYKYCIVVFYVLLCFVNK